MFYFNSRVKRRFGEIPRLAMLTRDEHPSRMPFYPGVKANRCRLVPRTGTRDKTAALQRTGAGGMIKANRCRPEGRRYTNRAGDGDSAPIRQ